MTWPADLTAALDVEIDTEQAQMITIQVATPAALTEAGAWLRDECAERIAAPARRGVPGPRCAAGLLLVRTWLRCRSQCYSRARHSHEGAPQGVRLADRVHVTR
ncbi:hypothetical protein [Amycolatopsis sp. cmx-11-12]|uniref:hypothetical protein n=1 Tax=Amycolatopsis sp. cmx-11-12 TaxID=2785795 RepID=UPI003918496F